MRRVLQLLVGILLVAGGLVLGTRGFGRLPPLGPILDPAGGLWAAGKAVEPRDEEISIAGMTGPVEVVIDTRGVPHIFAPTDLDAFRALGYVVARDRLFQLEFQSRAAAGTLSELIGAPALPVDQRARRFGFPRMVEQALATADSTDPVFRSITAYGEGINAWLDRMKRADLPVEFRLLGKTPSRWTPARTLLLFAQMSLTLASNDASLLKARIAAKVGRIAADALFPVDAPIQEPIQPSPDSLVRPLSASLPPPGSPDSAAAFVAGVWRGLAAQGLAAAPTSPEAAVGSNNWAVAPARTMAKQALLSGDPHLELTVPSIWYQAHLVVPGRLDVQGVTLPGAPWVVIGFNRSIGWSLTNTGSDVTDYYREAVDDARAPTRYQLDGAWRDLEQRIEVIRGARGDTLAIDTVRFTHRGPMLRVDSLWLSMAWTIYGAKLSGGEFLAANRAGTVAEFLDATRSYVAPAQNMLVADRRGTIAVRSTGRYPVRPGDGRGDLIRDGQLTASDWVSDLPTEYYPFAISPSRGYLFSANQQPVDPRVNGRFLGANWPSPWRAIRIRRLLAADSQVTPEAMARYQTDPTSERALAFLPVLLGHRSDSGRVKRASPEVKAARGLLTEWDGSYRVDDRRAVLFEAVMRELGRRTWDELSDSGTVDGPRPGEMVLLTVAADSASAWWDDRRTPTVERRDDILEASLIAGLDSVSRQHGAPTGDGWRWGSVHHANIFHFLRLPALSALDLEVGAGPSTLSPSSGRGTNGASWRMVVELGPAVRGFGIYPGGQSGNPASRHYRDFVSQWAAGKLDTLAFPAAASGLEPDRIEARLTFRPRGGSR